MLHKAFKMAFSVHEIHNTVHRNRPHGTESHLIGQVGVMREQGREEVLGEGVHGNTLPVDDLAKTAERTGWTQKKRKQDYNSLVS